MINENEKFITMHLSYMNKSGETDSFSVSFLIKETAERIKNYIYSRLMKTESIILDDDNVLFYIDTSEIVSLQLKFTEQ